ncbi:Ubiquitinyl hydrolase 1 [Caligus rogercresseyi]|uniref:Ubiquitinyl hydrolase 1 n=1 Tax=Caligus rogercresseyi TaxID=217165 RepID=A0A7T8K006_CALRO|nr:Ubiquitinyl hydrolase 1 [Caligus rogercresseyi]
MLDRLHTELLPLLPSDLSRYNPCLSSTVYSSNSLVTASSGMLQSEVTAWTARPPPKTRSLPGPIHRHTLQIH